MAKNKSKKPKNAGKVEFRVPNFTGSLDAKVPAENIIYLDRIAETGGWYCVSEAHDGAMFTAHGKTEPTGRRAAGLRTLAHLQALADGDLKHASPQEVEAARIELVRVLVEAAIAVGGHNGNFPVSRPRELVIFQLRTAKELVERKADKSLLARYVGPVACFLAGGFADGLLGKLGERTLDLLDKILAN